MGLLKEEEELDVHRYMRSVEEDFEGREEESSRQRQRLRFFLVFRVLDPLVDGAARFWPFSDLPSTASQRALASAIRS